MTKSVSFRASFHSFVLPSFLRPLSVLVFFLFYFSLSDVFGLFFLLLLFVVVVFVFVFFSFLLLLFFPPLVPKIGVQWAALGLPTGQAMNVRDLWARQDLGQFSGSFSANVTQREAAIFKFTVAS